MRLAFTPVALLLVIVLGGCSVVGTTSLKNSRALYNETIVTTDIEQLLGIIVRMRYQEPTGMLAVSSITSNVRVQTNVGAQFGVGPNSNFTGNLVPLAAGALYEENPTISYSPVQGQTFLRQMLAPIPLDMTALVLGVMGNSPATIALLLKEINGIASDDISASLDQTAKDGGFAQVAQLLASLHRRNALVWGHLGDNPSALALFLRPRSAVDVDEISRLSELLGLGVEVNIDEVRTLRVRDAFGSRSSDIIEIRTRSAFEMLGVAAASVDVPEEHLERGRAARLPPGGPMSQLIHIHRSAKPPEHALVAIEHHGWWFWIDATDDQSKATFRILNVIATARLADTADPRSSTPVLTIPVSR